MAEPAIKEEIESKNISAIKATDVMTGGQNRQRMLYYQLKNSIAKANSIDMIVSFLMESGVRMILDDLRSALNRGIRIRLLTGNYLGITQPSALYLIKHELGEQIELRFYNEKTRSFHPKSYFFHYENASEIYIGSSNISRSALTSGIEWNYRFTTNDDLENFHEFYDTFVDLFDNHSIIINDDVLEQYAKAWHKPAVLKELEKFDDEEHNVKVMPIFQPRGTQIEALYSLEKCRAEGAKRALVHAATGIGKTYLSAFDSVKFRRILFVAHREEILKQAAQSFYNVRQTKNYGFFNGNEKSTDKDIIFASVSTLGRKEYLTEKYFTRDYFDYVIIDEFHHAVNNNYMNIVDYFEPKFLLGLTATPERLDGKDVYALCDYNVPYEISLQDGINRGVLVPFHYYGVYDEIDYSPMRYKNGHYVEEDLNNAYIGNMQRNELIFKYYKKYRSKCALGFCCSRAHAEDMAKDFSNRGIKAVAVYSDSSGEFSERRDIAIEKLIKQEINVIFSVDMFNEGVDIPCVDLVMFLRPTESPTVFLQQLGRGLRKSADKEYLTVLDFIGNYKKIEKIPSLLSGNKRDTSYTLQHIDDLIYPDNCIVDFDMRVIDIFESLSKRERSVKEKIIEEFYCVKDIIGHVPNRQEFFNNMDDDIYKACKKNPKENPFSDYMKFLDDLKELTVDEKKIYNSLAYEFINLVEKTSMTKVYKMPVLLAFCKKNSIQLSCTDEDLVTNWKKFFCRGNNWRDLSYVKSYKEFSMLDDSKHLAVIKKNPVNFLIKSSGEFFTKDEKYTIKLNDDIESFVDNIVFVNHFKDAIQYRILEYYKKKYDAKND